jgi:hypothetical protein
VRELFNIREREEGRRKGMMIGQTKDQKEILEKEGKWLSPTIMMGNIRNYPE